MKKILAVIAFVMIGAVSFAQWTTPPSGNVWLQSVGNVGIGVSGAALTGDLMVTDETGPATFILNTTVTPTGTGNFTLGQYDMRFNGSNEFYRNVLRKDMTTGHTEMLQTLKGAAGTLAFLYVNLNTAKFEMRSGIQDAYFYNSGNVYFNNTPSQGGAVGIGTTGIASGVKLQVGGKVKCQEVEVAVTPWPDHVFQADYNLMPLNEVEAFISANKHLPGVPSEAEVASNGVNVGQMNATLLQKIEELTLYMIDLKKENDALKVRVNNLEK